MKHGMAIALLLPFTGWSAGFLLIYGAQAAGCSLGWQETDLGGISLLRTLLIMVFITTTIAIILASWVALNAEQFKAHTSEAIASIARYTAAAAIFSTAYVFSGVLWLKLCV